MKFSTRTVYGLQAVLVLASRYGEGSLSVSQIAKREGLSVAYLEQILNALKKKGLVKSVRGPQGGYVLAKKPSDLTLKQLFDALEGSGSAWGGGREALKADADEVKIANFIFWKKLRASLEDGLTASSLKDLMDQARQTKKEKKSSAAYPFHI